MKASSLSGRKLSIYLPDLSGGGAERLQLNLAGEFERAGMSVCFVVSRVGGELDAALSPEVEVVSLQAERQRDSLPRLARYLSRERPDILLSNLGHNNIVALWANQLAGAPSRVIVSVHNSLRSEVAARGMKFRALPLLYRASFPLASAVVAVSEGVAREVATMTGRRKATIDVIYNGVVSSDFSDQSTAAPNHPWFEEEVPVIIAAGRLVDQKDFATALRAFSQVVRSRPARMIILGDGPLRPELLAMRARMGLDDMVDLPGFIANPLPFIRKAAVLVCSSKFEGFGIVHAEALACGTPVVSTDCPWGPAEILDNGRYGALTPVGDPDALAGALLKTLAAPLPADVLKRRGQCFTVKACAEQYMSLFERIL